jgi:hypothetical protein
MPNTKCDPAGVVPFRVTRDEPQRTQRQNGRGIESAAGKAIKCAWLASGRGLRHRNRPFERQGKDPRPMVQPFATIAIAPRAGKARNGPRRQLLLGDCNTPRFLDLGDCQILAKEIRHDMLAIVFWGGYRGSDCKPCPRCSPNNTSQQVGDSPSSLDPSQFSTSVDDPTRVKGR